MLVNIEAECALCVHDNMLYDCMYLLAVMYVSASCLTKATDAWYRFTFCRCRFDFNVNFDANNCRCAVRINNAFDLIWINQSSTVLSRTCLNSKDAAKWHTRHLICHFFLSFAKHKTAAAATAKSSSLLFSLHSNLNNKYRVTMNRGVSHKITSNNTWTNVTQLHLMPLEQLMVHACHWYTTFLFHF